MSFKFVSASLQTDITADVPVLHSIDLGGVLVDIDYDMSFAIGNNDDAWRQYGITTSGLNATVNADVTFSTDGVDWATTVTMSGIPPKKVSNTVYCRYRPGADTATTAGTFLIKVNEQ